MKKLCDKPTTFMVHDNLTLNINSIEFRYEYDGQELNNTYLFSNRLVK